MCVCFSDLSNTYRKKTKTFVAPKARSNGGYLWKQVTSKIIHDSNNFALLIENKCCIQTHVYVACVNCTLVLQCMSNVYVPNELTFIMISFSFLSLYSLIQATLDGVITRKMTQKSFFSPIWRCRHQIKNISVWPSTVWKCFIQLS